MIRMLYILQHFNEYHAYEHSPMNKSINIKVVADP